MDRSEVFPLVFLVTFLALLTLVLGIFSTSFNMGVNYQSSQSSAITKMTDISIESSEQTQNFFYANVHSAYDDSNPWKYLYNVTVPDVGTYWGVGALQNIWTNCNDIQFIDSTDSKISIDIYFIKAPSMNEPQFMLYQHWGWWNQKYTYLTLTDVMDSYNNYSGHQYAKCDFQLKTGYTIYFIPKNGTSLASDIQTFQNFHIRVSVSAFNSTYSSADAFALVGQLLTFNVPGMNPILGYIIGTFIWTMGIYLIIRFVLMFIPFVSGGS